MLPDSLHDWQAPLLALLVSLAWAALLRGRGLGGLALGVGALAGFALVLGVGLASPRQLFERLPALMLGALVLAAPLAFLRARWAGAALGAAAALAGAWWLGGAPTWGPDAARAAPAMLGAALATALLMADTAGPWRAPGAALLLAGLVVLAAPPGPWVILALALGAASLGALAGGPAFPLAARLPLALGMAGLMLGPVLARGAPGDWLAALGPLAWLLLAPRLAGRRAPWAPWAGLAAALLALGWTLRVA